MKTTLRSCAAVAAMLLAPIGAMLVAQPVAAQQRSGDWRPAMVAQQEWRGDHDRWNHHYRRDDRAPQITDLTPAQGERVSDRGWTRISARFTDQGSGVDLASVVLHVDGHDVTRRSRLDGDDIHYAGDLRPGRHYAELVVRDRAGNATRRSWAFDVVDHGRNDGYYGSR